MTAPVDAVTAYARDVVEGREVAGLLVRLACERHLRDLVDGPGRGLKWRPEQAAVVIEFFEEHLPLPDVDRTDDGDEGSSPTDEAAPFLLGPFQKFIVGSLYGWYRVDGSRRFRVAYIETGKGSGKTPLAAGLGLFALTVDGATGSQIYAAATTEKQAKLCWTDAERMVKAAHQELAESVDITVNNLANIERGSFFRPISSEKRGVDGKRVYLAIIDELHEHRTSEVAIKMRAGTKGRRNALVFEITNSGYDRKSVCWNHHEYSRRILQGQLINDSWFAYVCHLDACPACRDQGYVQPNENCQACDRWDVEGPHWQKANPNLGRSLTWEYLREQVTEAQGMPDQQALVRRLNFCEWTENRTVWIPADRWRACQREFLEEELLGRECFLGIDLSSKHDLTCVVALFIDPIEEDLPLPIEDDPDRDDELEADVDKLDQTYLLNFQATALPYFFIPRDVMFEKIQQDRVPYDEWERAGYVRVTDGTIIDLDAVQRLCTKELPRKFSVQKIGFDPTNATHLATRLQARFGKDNIIEVGQGFRQMSEPSKVFAALVRAQRFRHNGNPCLTWNVTNMGVETNSWKDIRPIKLDDTQRIDGGAASIIGLHVVIRQPVKKARRRVRGGFSVFADRHPPEEGSTP